MSTIRDRERWAKEWIRTGAPPDKALQFIDWNAFDYVRNDLQQFWNELPELSITASALATRVTGYTFSPLEMMSRRAMRHERLRNQFLQALEREHLREGYISLVPRLIRVFR